MQIYSHPTWALHAPSGLLRASGAPLTMHPLRNRRPLQRLRPRPLHVVPWRIATIAAYDRVQTR